MVVLPYTMEEWKHAIESYEISNYGNCRRKCFNGLYIEITGTIQNRGYKYFQLQRFGKRINYLFHHLVAEAFLGERPNNLVIDHIDRNKLNNHVTNLRLVTITENSLNRVSTEDAKGYYITPSGYFRVIVNINNTTIKYGSYKSEYDAIRRFTYESEKINRLRMV